MKIQPGNHKHEARDRHDPRDTDQPRDEALRNEDLRNDEPRDNEPRDNEPRDNEPRDNELRDEDRPVQDEAQQPVPVQNQAPVAARTKLFEEQQAAGFREQWREVQAGFVDEPRAAVREAETLVSQMMDQLTAQLAEQKRSLENHSETVDTEQLRVAMQRYRSLFDQMLQV